MDLREKLDSRQEKLLDASLFFGRFLAVGAVFHLLLFWRPDTTALQGSIASATVFLLELLGKEVRREGLLLFMEGDSFLVSQDCTGWKSVSAFLGLGFASRMRNLKLIVAGIAAIMIANIVRIVSTLYLSGFFSFDLIHGTLWKWGLTAFTLILWAVLLNAERSGEVLEKGEDSLLRLQRTFL
jgi:exosortase/archaeosortase family protein